MFCFAVILIVVKMITSSDSLILSVKLMTVALICSGAGSVGLQVVAASASEEERNAGAEPESGSS